MLRLMTLGNVPAKTAAPVALLGLIAAILLCAFGCVVMGCGHGSTACAVVDVAKTNCDTWIKYLGPDGKEHTVQVDREDLMIAVRRSEARQAGQPVPPASAAAP